MQRGRAVRAEPSGPAGATSPAAHDVAVEATALELQRAMVVARMMGVAPEWASGSAATPGWWLDTWARRLAGEWLSAPLRDEVLAWLDQVRDLLADRQVAPTRIDVLHHWLETARLAGSHGAELEARVLAEVGTRGM